MWVKIDPVKPTQGSFTKKKKKKKEKRKSLHLLIISYIFEENLIISLYMTASEFQCSSEKNVMIFFSFTLWLTTKRFAVSRWQLDTTTKPQLIKLSIYKICRKLNERVAIGFPIVIPPFYVYWLLFASVHLWTLSSLKLSFHTGNGFLGIFFHSYHALRWASLIP